jgi:hypothetical protein
MFSTAKWMPEGVIFTKHVWFDDHKKYKLVTTCPDHHEVNERVAVVRNGHKTHKILGISIKLQSMRFFAAFNPSSSIP